MGNLNVQTSSLSAQSKNDSMFHFSFNSSIVLIPFFLIPEITLGCLALTIAVDVVSAITIWMHLFVNAAIPLISPRTVETLLLVAI